jgi:1-acyl-sn-glycerol-3-phosphate acyltransferase
MATRAISERAPALVFDAFAKYFRFETEGLGNLIGAPTSLIVGYHGRPFAWDMILLVRRVLAETGVCPRIFTQGLFRETPGLRELAAGWGAIYEEPTAPELAAMRASGQHLAVCPGGTREALRPAWRRYTVDFGDRRGYLRLAAKHRLPIVPVVATGIDDTYIGLNDGYRLSHRLFGHGDAPVWLGMGVGGFYPFAMPWPAKVRQRVGAPIDLAPIRAEHPNDEHAFLRAANDVVTTTLQRMLDEMREGRKIPTRR